VAGNGQQTHHSRQALSNGERRSGAGLGDLSARGGDRGGNRQEKRGSGASTLAREKERSRVLSSSRFSQAATFHTLVKYSHLSNLEPLCSFLPASQMLRKQERSRSILLCWPTKHTKPHACLNVVRGNNTYLFNNFFII
jgi:hypothetical protein